MLSKRRKGFMSFDILMVFVTSIIVVILITIAILQPKFEASSYYRLTGKKVGYWDAVWLDLRIQEQVK